MTAILKCSAKEEKTEKNNSKGLRTLRIFGITELGPLEEKYETLGAGTWPISVLLGDIWTVGFLQVV